MKSPRVISDPEILGGTPVFIGTRVPVRVIFEHLEAGDSLEVFLVDFPSSCRRRPLSSNVRRHEPIASCTSRLL